MKLVLVPIANGSEEMEAVIPIDVLRRAGARVIVASVEDRLQVTASRQTVLVADRFITDVENHSFDLVVVPGGMPGAERLRDNDPLRRILLRQQKEGRRYAAICAAPVVVLQSHGLLQGPATCHPAFADRLKDQSLVDQSVVVSGNCTTSRAPGTAFAFALELVKQLFGEAKAIELNTQMVIAPPG